MLSKFSAVFFPALGLAALFLCGFGLIHSSLVRQYGAARARQLSLIILLVYTLFALILGFFLNEVYSRALIISALCQIPIALVMLRQKGKA